MGELALIYELYLEYQHQVETLEAAGHTGSTLYADYVAERDRAWREYHTRGGHLPPLHVGESGAPEDSSAELGSSEERPVLRYGSRGPAVADVQRRLGIKDDGIFGAETRRHTKQFQRNAGLDDDGVIGPLTWAALLDPFSHDPKLPEVPSSPPDEILNVCGDETNTIALIDGVLQWGTVSAWCGDTAPLLGFFDTAAVSEGINVEIYSDVSGETYTVDTTGVDGGHLIHRWKVLDVLPHRDGSSYKSSLDVLARAGSAKTSTPLRINFISKLEKQHCAVRRAHFDLSVEDCELLISSDIEYVPGWAAQIVKLGTSVPASTGGVISDLNMKGWRWMKKIAGVPHFWDGEAWQPLPAALPLDGTNHSSIGFYESTGAIGAASNWLGFGGRTFTSQRGGVWPEQFHPWEIDAPQHKKKIQQWVDTIATTWSGKFDMKRIGCRSTNPSCCRYSTRAEVRFIKQETFRKGLLIIADGNIRANSSLFFLGGPQLSTVAHEFGHHLGNPDEYSGAAGVDRTLNGDGAVHGIDHFSIMGKNKTHVKKRHYRAICKHLSKMVLDQIGKSYSYEAVRP